MNINPSSVAEDNPRSFLLLLLSDLGLDFAFRRFKVVRGVIKEKRDRDVCYQMPTGPMTPPKPTYKRVLDFIVSTEAGDVIVAVSETTHNVMFVGDALPVRYRVNRFNPKDIDARMIKQPNFVLGTNQA